MRRQCLHASLPASCQDAPAHLGELAHRREAAGQPDDAAGAQGACGPDHGDRDRRRARVDERRRARRGQLAPVVRPGAGRLLRRARQAWCAHQAPDCIACACSPDTALLRACLEIELQQAQSILRLPAAEPAAAGAGHVDVIMTSPYIIGSNRLKQALWPRHELGAWCACCRHGHGAEPAAVLHQRGAA